MNELANAAEAMIRQYWPLHGPYSPGHTAAATSTIAELVRSHPGGLGNFARH